MRLVRERGGNRGRQIAVEAAHQNLHGCLKPFWEIAVELYDDRPTQSFVLAEIKRRYGVEISKKTASLWINRGLEERQHASGTAKAVA
jgi:hypothetical protein